MPNAVDVAWWREGGSRCTSPRPVTFVSVMRLAGRKRPLALLDMVERARAVVPDQIGFRLLIVGDGPLGRRVRAEVAARDLEDVVVLLGERTREEIRDLYRRADVYVAPAYQESFGIAALEARAAGLPVIAMRSGGVGEFITGGVEGILCADDEAMAGTIASLVGDPQVLASMAAHNAAHAPAQDWPCTLAAFDETYQRLRGRNALLRSTASVRSGR